MNTTQTPGPAGAAPKSPPTDPGVTTGLHDPQQPRPKPMPLPPRVYADPFAYSSPAPCCLMCKPFVSG